MDVQAAASRVFILPFRCSIKAGAFHRNRSLLKTDWLAVRKKRHSWWTHNEVNKFDGQRIETRNSRSANEWLCFQSRWNLLVALETVAQLYPCKYAKDTVNFRILRTKCRLLFQKDVQRSRNMPQIDGPWSEYLGSTHLPQTLLQLV